LFDFSEIGPGSLGLGFETREASTKFKEALIASLSLEQTIALAKMEQQRQQQQQQKQQQQDQPDQGQSSTIATGIQSTK
jgi:hypothetical protein